MADELVKVAEDSARGSFFLISGSALSTGILAISSILVARFLGPELYGQYTLALVVPQLLFLFTDLGINQGIMKFTASLRVQGETTRLTQMIKYGLLLRAVIGIAIFAVSFAFADLFAAVFLQRPDLAVYIRIASTAVVFQVIFTTAISAFVGFDKTEYHALALNIHAIAKTIISIALVLVGFSLTGALLGHAASYVIAAAAGALILVLMLREKEDRQEKSSVTDDLKTLIHYGAPLSISWVLIGLIPFYQNVILAMFTTDADIGNYKAAINFATLLGVLAISITTALLPAFSKLDALTRQETKAFFKAASKYTTMLIMPITTLIIMFSGEIVEIIYGSTYQSAALFLAIYGLVYLLVGLGYLTLSSFYNGLGKTKITMMISLITFFSLAGLSPLFAATHGVIGVIMAFLIASTAGILYGAYTARTRFGIEFEFRLKGKIYLVAILSTPPPLILLQFSPLPMLFNVGAGALLYLFTYATLIPLTKIIDQSELQFVKDILQRIKPLKPITGPLIRYQKKILNLKKPQTLFS